MIEEILKFLKTQENAYTILGVCHNAKAAINKAHKHLAQHKRVDRLLLIDPHLPKLSILSTQINALSANGVEIEIFLQNASRHTIEWWIKRNAIVWVFTH